MPVQCTCHTCGRGFSVKPSKVPTARYCSRACQNIGAVRAFDYPCEACGTVFRAYPSNRKIGGDRYCSQPCHRAARTRTLGERFWEKVQKSDGCWLWMAKRKANGYGSIGSDVNPSAHLYAHRVAWTLTHGPIPDGLYVCHHCDNPPCVRPDHLFLGTAADNAADMSAKGRGWRQRRP